ncbi:MAG: hypothetical protein KME52_21035 [Desmonostoc geniculatum HA4340-LM1]|nr:hypothetical protein [Desmonostoc geniculatum HA4340-LM1]
MSKEVKYFCTDSLSNAHLSLTNAQAISEKRSQNNHQLPQLRQNDRK